MITLHRLNGQPVGINADLIERVDVTPNTIITLVDGTKYLVAETLDEVVDAVRSYRASIVALSDRMDLGGASRAPSGPSRPGPVLQLVQPKFDDGEESAVDVHLTHGASHGADHHSTRAHT